MRLIDLFVLASLGLTVSACAPGGSLPSDDEEEAVEESDPRALSGDAVYIVTRQDFRKCMYPMCGGVYVKQVNKAKTTCLDGTKQADCYVADFDFTNTGLSEDEGYEVKNRAIAGQVLLSGALANLQDGFAKLQVNKAHEARTEAAPSGTFYLLQSSGIQCIAAPCASMEGHKLNSSVVKPLTDINLSALGLPLEEEQAVLAQIMDSSLVAAGSISSKQTPTGTIKKLNVSQIYSTVESKVEQQLCLADDDCGEGSYCDHTECLSNCPEGMVCPAVCYGACTAGEAPPPAPSGASCEAACGGSSSDGSCYCDSACEYYGDCCSDYVTACL
ncbi:MAG: hypothetical protein IPG04_16980 [Polyangiaceae bacterium]|jgi:hypothetical protein|nr:hypothetical protein [Polyangiaceae bacterium]